MKKLLKKLALYPYYYIGTSGFVRRIRDRKARKLHSAHKAVLDSEQNRILSELNKNGLVISSLERLFGKNNADEILNYYKHAKQTPEVKKTKSFLFATENSSLDFENPLVRFSLEKKILDIGNEYLGLWSLLRYAVFTETIPISEKADAKGSQTWHRDLGIGEVYKAFIYLTDVEKIEDGPFIFVAGSHNKGRWRNFFKRTRFGREGFFIPDEKLQKFLKENNADGDIVHCFGKAGTVIFADTLGIHKGGYSISKPRIMTISLYESPSSLGEISYKNTISNVPADLSKEATFAIGR